MVDKAHQRRNPNTALSLDLAHTNGSSPPHKPSGSASVRPTSPIESLGLRELTQLWGLLTEGGPHEVCPVCGAPRRLQSEVVLGVERSFWVDGCNCRERVRSRLESLRALEENRERLRRWIERNRPGRFAKATLDAWPGRQDHRRVHRLAKRYVEEFPKLRNVGGSVLILGPVGSGKTHLLYALAHDIMREHKVPVRVLNVAMWIQQINWKIAAGESAEPIVREAMEAPVLGLVDLGKEATTEFTRRTLYLLLEHRWQQQLPVLVDANFRTLGQLKDHYARDPVMQDAITSRLLGLCRGNIWVLLGHDRRVHSRSAERIRRATGAHERKERVKHEGR